MSDGPTGVTAWSVNYCGHDYSGALNRADISKIKYLTEDYIPLGYLDRVTREVFMKVQETSPDDYLLISGLTVLNAIAAIAWYRRHNQVKLLIWDSREGYYRTMTVAKTQLDLMENMLNGGGNEASSESGEST